ncbi:MAG: phenylacetate-CoA oxygenase subunit PaaC [Chloroflexi bacterium]|nr:phenylacetate-CoA oxygenase subunit PaaC [Ardenticatenaceae bacterium]MBL1129491.1 phenylacetate-CoA oxygenase subunit PaaI [Chloroflexota bacterium]NOG35573.1 phenylacetate-CoA oxygenase subunit PaaC [Chloroflexota bacterium]GIK58740.1 MAG: phenylacetate-CoA oxygenase subunit PaaI [Chloroflexota bacterium]
MNTNHQTALAQKLLFLADDELILAHRNSEWTGHGPILEEDIAFTNIALDEMGHAATWHRLRQELTGEDVDTAVFFRDPAAYRNVQLVELPHGDWAFSMLRQYLFDVYELVHLAQLATSSYRPLAEAAAKIRVEEIYHLRHTAAWVTRLGLGTAESHQRMQTTLDTLWPYAQQLFVNLPEDEALGEMGMAVSPSSLLEEWQHLTTTHLTQANLIIPTNHMPPTTDRADHTDHLTSLLAEMQSVARQYPTAVW